MFAPVSRKLLCLLVLGGCIAVGCVVANRPDFDRVPWRSLTIYYCVGSSSPVSQRSWFTHDRTTLDALRKALTIRHVGDLWGIVTYQYNKVEVVLESGERWDLHFFEPTKLSALKQPSPETSYKVDLEPGFFTMLESLVTSCSSNDVHFFYQSPVDMTPHEIRKPLETPGERLGGGHWGQVFSVLQSS